MVNRSDQLVGPRRLRLRPGQLIQLLVEGVAVLESLADRLGQLAAVVGLGPVQARYVD